MEEKEKESEKKDSPFGVFEHPLIRREFDEILIRKVSKMGNSGHVSIPKKHIGKECLVTIWKDIEVEEYKPKEAKT